MSASLAALRKACAVRFVDFARPLMIAVVGLGSLPVAGTSQGTSNLYMSTDHGVQVGHSTGRVLNLDVELPAVTLDHRPIVSSGMPDMTMIFRVQHPRLLAGLSVGDEVQFEVRRVKGTLVIFEIDKVSP